MNHLKTSNARSTGLSEAAGATKTEGLSAQNAGSSTADLVSRTNGGAVMLERSPRMTAMDFGTARYALEQGRRDMTDLGHPRR